MSEEQRLTYDDIAARLKLSRENVAALVRAKKLPVIKLSRKVHRFLWSEVEATLAKLTVRPIK